MLTSAARTSRPIRLWPPRSTRYAAKAKARPTHLEQTHDEAGRRRNHQDLAQAGGGFDHRVPQVAQPHALASIAEREAEHDDHGARRHRAVFRLEVEPEHRIDERSEGHEEHPSLREHRHDAWDPALLHLAEAVARRLEVRLDEKGGVVHHRGQDRRDRDLLVRDLQEVRHHESHRAHDRRHELAAVGRAGFDRGGELRRHAGALHQRNGHHADRDRVRGRDTGDHAEEARADDRHLRRSAAVSAHQRNGEIVEEARSARTHEELPHQHERDDHDDGDLKNEAEEAIVVEIEVGEELAHLHLARLELAGHQVTDQHVAREREHDDDERPPYGAARGLYGEQRDGDGQRHGLEVDRARDRGKAGKMDGDIRAGRKRQRGARPVVPRHRRRRARRSRFSDRDRGRPEAQERERQADAEGRGGELLGEKHQPDRPEEIQRPGDRASDEECRKRALRAP